MHAANACFNLLLKLIFRTFIGSRGLKGDSGTCPESCDVFDNITRLQRDLQGNVSS